MKRLGKPTYTLPRSSTVQRLKPRQGCSAIPQTHEPSEQMHKAHIWESFDNAVAIVNWNTWKTLFPYIVRWEITNDELDSWSLPSSCSLPHWALLSCFFSSFSSFLSPTHTFGMSSTCSGLCLCWEGWSRPALMGPDSIVSFVEMCLWHVHSWGERQTNMRSTWMD